MERAFAEVIIAQLESTNFPFSIIQTPTAVDVGQIRNAASEIVGDLKSETRGELLTQIIAGGSISSEALAVKLDATAIASLLQLSAARIEPACLSIIAPWSIRRRGVETRFVIEGARQEIDQNLKAKTGLALRWFDEVKAGASITSIASREGLSLDRIAQIMRLAWLAPEIVDAIASGQQPERLTANTIFKSRHIHNWAEQQAWVSGL